MFGTNPNRGRVPLETSRLKLPPVEATESLSPLKLLGSQAADPEQTDRGTTDLLIQGLVDRLPKPNTIWSLDERAKWLRTAASVFGLVYKDSDGEQRQIGVVFAKQNPPVASGATSGQEPKTD